MATNGYQTTMFSQLDADVELEDFVVLIDDPRWAACVEELRSAKWICIDTEFCSHRGPWKRSEINYWKSLIRLVQVGLPSGLAMVFNLGGLLDNRELHLRRHIAALDVLKHVVEDHAVPKVGMYLVCEYMLLRINFGWRMRCMRDVMLMSQVYYAGVGAKPKRYTETGAVHSPMLKHNLASICERLGIAVDKTEQLSDWAGPLQRKQLNYAGRDVIVPRLAWVELTKRAQAEGLMKSFEAECSAQPAFCEVMYNGLPIDLDMARADLATWEQVRDDFAKPFLDLFPGVSINAPGQVAEVLSNALDSYQCAVCKDEYDPMLADPKGTPLPADWKCHCTSKSVPERLNVRNFFEQKLIRGKMAASPTTSDEVLSRFDHVWYVRALLEARSTSACMNWLRAAVEHAFDTGSGTRIRAEFKQIAGGGEGSDDGTGRGMGRSSASKPLNTQNPSNLQPAHEKAGAVSVRRCIRPLPGRAFIVADLSQAHARIAAQWSKDPVMLRDFNAGRDFHLAMTHRLMEIDGVKISFDEAVQIAEDKTHALHKDLKSRRQGCKSTNYACVPLYSKALTRKGWCTYDQLVVGEDILAYDPKTERNVWTPLLAINVYDDAEVFNLMFGKTSKWGAHCTLDHRWYGTFTKSTGGAAQRRSKKYGDNAQYYVKVPGTCATGAIPRNFRARVSAPADGGPGLARFQVPMEKYGYDWTACILQMTVEERRAFLIGCLISEGHLATGASGSKVWMIAQKPNELGEAMLLAAYLEGSKVTVGSSKADNGPLWRICLNRTDVVTGQHKRLEPLGHMPVWCPTTKFGTWVMRQGNNITITGNSLNLSGVNTLKRQMETMPVPIKMEEDEVAKLIKVWKDLYRVLHYAQRRHIKVVNSYSHRFHDIGVDGEYGESRALTGRRLCLVKEWKPPRERDDGSMSAGYWSVKATDAVSSIWMMTEADIVKRAMGKLVPIFDSHPEWDWRWANMAHDEVDGDCDEKYALEVATVVQREFDDAMTWAGVVDLPVNEKDADPRKLIKTDWSAK